MIIMSRHFVCKYSTSRAAMLACYYICPPINIRDAGDFHSQILVPLKQSSPVAIYGHRQRRSLVLFVAAQRARPRGTNCSGDFNPQEIFNYSNSDRFGLQGPSKDPCLFRSVECSQRNCASSNCCCLLFLYQGSGLTLLRSHGICLVS